MLSIRRRRNEAALIERYWSGLRRERATQPLAGLDPNLANVIAEVERELRPPRLSDTSIEQLWRRVDARASETTRSAWSGPAIDPTARRRTVAPPITEREEQPIMSDLSRPADIEPIPLQQRRWFRETLKLVAAAIVFIVVGAVLALTLRGDDDQTPAIGPSGPTPTAESRPIVPTETTVSDSSTPTVKASPATGLLTDEVIARIQVGDAPLGLTAAAGSLWVPDIDGAISRIDLTTNAVVATIPVGSPPGNHPIIVAAAGDEIWALHPDDKTVQRIDPATNTIIATIAIADVADPQRIAVGAGAVWVSNTRQNTLVRIDPATQSIVAVIEGLSLPHSIGVTADAVWVVSTGNRTLDRIDPATNSIVARIGGDTTSVQWTNIIGNDVWIIHDTRRVSRIDPATNTLATTFEVSAASELVSVAFGAGSVWVGDPVQATLYRLDATTGDLLAATELEPPLIGITFTEGSLWAALEGTDEVVRVNPPTAQPTPAPSPTLTSSLPSFGTIAATMPVGQNPRHFAAGEGSLWVTNADDGTVSRIDLATNQVVATIVVVPPDEFVVGVDGATQVDAIAVGGGAVWVTALNSAQLARIDPATNAVVARVSLSAGIHELEFGGGALWGKATFSNRIDRIDPATNAVVASIPVAQPGSLVFLNDALWVQGPTELSKIDPTTNAVVATAPYSEAGSGNLVTSGMLRAAGGRLWVSTIGKNELIEIDPATASVVNVVTLPDGMDDFIIAGSDDAVYICPCFGQLNTIWRFDLATRELNGSLLVPHVAWIEFEAGAIWGYTSYNEMTRVDPLP